MAIDELTKVTLTDEGANAASNVIKVGDERIKILRFLNEQVGKSSTVTAINDSTGIDFSTLRTYLKSLAHSGYVK